MARTHQKMLSITSHQKGMDKGMMRCYFTPTKVLLATGQVTVAASQDVERAELCVVDGGVQWAANIESRSVCPQSFSTQ